MSKMWQTQKRFDENKMEETGEKSVQPSNGE